MNKLDSCYEKAIETIKHCSTPNGFFASGGIDGYNAVWARDSMITALGASLIKEPIFEKTFEKSIITLANNQSANGQIPNAVDRFRERKPHTDYQSIDSSLWYIIGHYIYKKRYNNKLFKNYNKSIISSLNWLRCQDSGEIGMLVQQPTSDWQDAFPHKYGHTINTQALYYKVLTLIGAKKNAKILRKNANQNKDLRLWNGKFYWPYRWKNHNKYKEIGEWFDSLGNLLAVVFDLADKKQAEKIIKYIKRKRINKPYPVKTIYPPITKKSEFWHDYFLDCDAGKPNHYSNGGIWGFNGCFYILSLIKLKKFKEAKKHLSKLAELNLKANFPEWTNPKTKKSYGRLQAWEAGMYILAYESLKKKKILI
ncbi:hypothetical protein GF386_03985 [Candidatus Pacearchaeota archaeon]|nr:hypothetical protein [Candidatus Pacearchaeota archaeon]MBD3283309.1 hypothetical protein [Candidatus Pacearchaeota archaeon]